MVHSEIIDLLNFIVYFCIAYGFWWICWCSQQSCVTPGWRFTAGCTLCEVFSSSVQVSEIDASSRIGNAPRKSRFKKLNDIQLKHCWPVLELLSTWIPTVSTPASESDHSCRNTAIIFGNSWESWETVTSWNQVLWNLVGSNAILGDLWCLQASLPKCSGSFSIT